MISKDAPSGALSASLQCHINETVVDNLASMGISEFFPVQRTVIPLLMNLNAKSCLVTRDLCVSAPTGSGKTLAYAVPIASLLCDRLFTRLRALIVLPSRELANQVYAVMCQLVAGTDLRVLNCIGQTDFYEEQQLLVGPQAEDIMMCDSIESVFANRRLYARDNGHPLLSAPTVSNVDIMICTPGRLIEHLQHTKGFSLSSLRFLVLDEADRLLGNAYHYWVKRLIDSTRDRDEVRDLDGQSKALQQGSSLGKRSLPDYTPQGPSKPSLQRLLFSATLTDNPGKLALLGIRNPVLLKVDPRSTATALAATETEGGDQQANRLTAASGRKEYVLPSTLREYVRICDTAVRPLHLIGILLEAVGSSLSGFTPEMSAHDDEKDITSSSSSLRQSQAQPYFRNTCQGNKDMCIVFASSVDMTHRLARLLQLFNGQHNSHPAVTLPPADNTTGGSPLAFGGRVAEMSRLASAEERERVIKDCMRGDVKVLVSSDHMARGIDLPNARLVINYDQPKFAKTYVHRVGRTARAGKDGYCVTLLKNGQSGNFRKLRGEIDGGYWSATADAATSAGASASGVESAKCKISKATLENASTLYGFSLKHLQPLLDSEK